LKKSDMSTLTRSATLPYATADGATLIAAARRLLLDPVDIGPVRLLGVGFSGLSDVRQESLFPDLEQWNDEHTDAHPAAAAAAMPTGWRVGDDVHHDQYGHGWTQGAGHGVMTVRFETRASGPGPARTFLQDTPDVTRANPVDSLDWPEFIHGLLDESTPPGDHVVDR
jgi:DNA polymerase-4